MVALAFLIMDCGGGITRANFLTPTSPNIG
jgi:hypothetical protein